MNVALCTLYALCTSFHGVKLNKSLVHPLKELADLMLKRSKWMLLAYPQVGELVPGVCRVHRHVTSDTVVPRLLVYTPALENFLNASSRLYCLLVHLLYHSKHWLSTACGTVVDIISRIATEFLLVETIGY